MKRFLAIALCLLSCLFFREETVCASRHVPSSLYDSKLPHSTGTQGAEEVKAGDLPGQEAKPENKPEVHQAARPAEPASQQSFMNTELFALLLLIMVLGMLYTNPTR